MKALWPRWTLLPAAPFVLWSLYCVLIRRELRWELILVSFVAPFLSYASESTKRLYFGLLPLGLVGLLYDGMRFVKNWGVDRATVHVCDLRAHEMAWFGITSNGVRMTLHDYFQTHWSVVADCYFAIPYGVYLFIPLLYVGYLYRRDYAAMQRYAWSFLALNVAGFVTYHLYPAAPPWYFHANGCGVDIAARASEGSHLARVDHWLGFRYFHGLYGRSNDVFGAVPSLHVAYPLLMVIVGWDKHRWPMRVAMIVFWLSTCCAAVYLDHHWVIDVVVGLTYTVAIYLAVRWVLARGRAELPGEVAVPARVSLAGAMARVSSASAAIRAAAEERVSSARTPSTADAE
jgi:hypothetical protein